MRYNSFRRGAGAGYHLFLLFQAWPRGYGSRRRHSTVAAPSHGRGGWLRRRGGSLWYLLVGLCGRLKAMFSGYSGAVFSLPHTGWAEERGVPVGWLPDVSG